ncbi:MAG TPA: biotin/lipoyl-binding protein, partial [Gemmatimonadales bacterium]|nr:biotin/lipoyl-binding protein [Gemmatimonadales bacterium]
MRALCVVLLAGSAVGCGGSNAAPPAGGSSAAERGRGGVGAQPVEVVLARTDTVVDAITATGQVEPLQSIQLRPEVDGRLVAILVREGAMVAQGTPLFKVDDGELKTQVARAQ